MPNSKDQVESTLADLGISTIADKIPSLMDHYLGGELITSNDEKTRAAMIMGFMIGNEIIYIPVLFLNGKVKGTEVGYLKKSDVFFSVSKPWIEYLTTRAPSNLGKPSNLPPGLSTQPAPTTLRPFYMPPQIGGKIASLDIQDYPDVDQMPGWRDNQFWNKKGSVFPDAYDVFNRFMKTAMRDQVCKIASRPEFTLPAVLQSLGHETYVGFTKFLLGQPALFEKMAEFYPLDSLKLTFQKPMPKVAEAPKEQKLARCTIDDLYADPGRFTQEEKTRLMREGDLILDKRADEEKTLSYREEHLTRFDAPRTNGFYEILNSFGDLEKVFVSVGPFLINAPKSSFHGHLVLDPESGIYAVPMESQELMVRYSHDFDEEKWKEKFSNLSSISSVSPNKTYLLVGPNLNTSAPFVVLNKSGSGKNIDLTVRTPYEFRARANAFTSSTSRGDKDGLWDDDAVIKIVDQPGFKVQRQGSVVFVPNDWKVLELDGESSRYSYSGDQSKKDILRRITPGSNSTITSAMVNKGVFALTTHKDAMDRYSFSIGKHASVSMKESDARWFLVSRVGISLSDAEECLATGKFATTKRFVKVGADYGPIFGGDPLPPVDNQLGTNNSGVMEIQPQSTLQTINMSNPEIPNSDGWNPDDSNWDKIKPQHIDFLMRAANSGSQSVFDPAMIGMILKTTRASAQVEQWLPDLVNALDVKCRLLLLFYWQNNEFADDYGKDELSEFENVLLDSIATDGKLVLFLKQKAGESTNSNIDAFESD